MMNSRLIVAAVFSALVLFDVSAFASDGGWISRITQWFSGKPAEPSTFSQVESLLRKERMWIGDPFSKACPAGYKSNPNGFNGDMLGLDPHMLFPPLLDSVDCVANDASPLLRELIVSTVGGKFVTSVLALDVRTDTKKCDASAAASLVGNNFGNVKADLAPSSCGFDFELDYKAGLDCEAASSSLKCSLHVISRAEMESLDNQHVCEHSTPIEMLSKNGKCSIKMLFESYHRLASAVGEQRAHHLADHDSLKAAYVRDIAPNLPSLKLKLEKYSAEERRSIEPLLDEETLVKTIQQSYQDFRTVEVGKQ